MAFNSCEFTFDGKSCMDYGLMVYSFGSNGQDENVSFTSTGTMLTDNVAGRYSSFFYGVEQNEPLQFSLVFGANPDMIDNHRHLDRYEVEEIAAWLTGHNQRKWLQIIQPDMEEFRYKCTISDLKLITYGDLPWAFSCVVTCDSPYAYSQPKEYHYDISGETEITFFNRSTHNGYYRPELVITTNGSTSFSIVNKSDNNREFAFNNLPASVTKIYVDNENQVIRDDSGLNLYPYFNFRFLQLVRGDNELVISGDCGLDIICEFPVNIGG